jgi:hypothetical protein
LAAGFPLLEPALPELDLPELALLVVELVLLPVLFMAAVAAFFLLLDLLDGVAAGVEDCA